MRVIVFFDESEFNVSDFEIYARLLDKVLVSYFDRSPFDDLSVMMCRPGGLNETQKEKACNKSVCKQRRNKTVNARKSS